MMSIHAGYSIPLKETRLNFKANVFNALNTRYISDARNNAHQDGTNDFDANSATVFLGQGIRINASIGFQF
jgi:outer membrane receptor protein involved in Fe transport